MFESASQTIDLAPDTDPARGIDRANKGFFLLLTWQHVTLHSKCSLLCFCITFCLQGKTESFTCKGLNAEIMSE